MMALADRAPWSDARWLFFAGPVTSACFDRVVLNATMCRIADVERWSCSPNDVGRHHLWNSRNAPAGANRHGAGRAASGSRRTDGSWKYSRTGPVEKDFVKAGICNAPTMLVSSVGNPAERNARIGLPAVIKTAAWLWTAGPGDSFAKATTPLSRGRLGHPKRDPEASFPSSARFPCDRPRAAQTGAVNVRRPENEPTAIHPEKLQGRQPRYRRRSAAERARGVQEIATALDYVRSDRRG